MVNSKGTLNLEPDALSPMLVLRLWPGNLRLLWPPDERTNSLEKTLMLGKTEGKRRRGPQRMGRWRASPTQWMWPWASWGRQWRTGRPGVLLSVGQQESAMTKGLSHHLRSVISFFSPLLGYCENHTEHLTQCLVYRKPLINSNYHYCTFDSYYKVQV